MKALVQDRYGSATALEFRDIDQPTPGPEEVLVRVMAAGMDRGAWHFMTGQPYLMRAARRSSVPVGEGRGWPQ